MIALREASPSLPTTNVQARENVALRAEEQGVPPATVQIIRSSDPAAFEKVASGAMAVGSVAGCIAAIGSVPATGGASAPLAVPLAIGTCGAALGVTIKFISDVWSDLGDATNWVGRQANTACEWVGLCDEDEPAPIDDGATGRLRGSNVPADILQLLYSRTASFQADAGPFEGVWSCRSSTGGRFTIRLYDRRGWVVGNFADVDPARKNIIGRRTGNGIRGRINNGRDYVPYTMVAESGALLAQNLHTLSYKFSGTRTDGPPTPPPRRDSGRSDNRFISDTPLGGTSPRWVKPLIAVGAVAVAGAAIWAATRKGRR